VPLRAGKSRSHKRTDNIERKFHSGHTRAETKHVAIVVFARLMGRISIPAESRPNAAEFVGRDRSSHAAAADQYPNLRRACLYCFSNLFCVIGIIDRSTVVSAEVDQIMAGFAQLRDNALIERVASMIRADCYLHRLLKLFQDFSINERAWLKTLSMLKPNSLRATSPGAEPPKRSRQMTSPLGPT
jgi:hypothetical protein